SCWSTSVTKPRSNKLSRDQRTPSGVVQRRDWPCCPALETITQVSALAGGWARSATGVCARTDVVSAIETSAISATRKRFMEIPYRRSYSAGPRDWQAATMGVCAIGALAPSRAEGGFAVRLLA